MTQELPIHWDFRGAPLPEAHRGLVRLARSADYLRIEIEAPYFGDEAPAAPVGPTDRLWEHEVCEIFIADDAERYLEVELSPHGHHLVIELAGVRRAVRSLLPISYVARIELAVPRADGSGGEPLGRFFGDARVPWAYLPAAATRVNAYAIHGPANRRCYHAHSPTSPQGGEVADFHTLSRFVSFQLG